MWTGDLPIRRSPATTEQEPSSPDTFSLEEGREITRLKGHLEPVIALEFSADGGWLASGDAGQAIKIWDWARNKVHLALTNDEGYGLTIMAFSPDRGALVVGDATQQIRCFETAGGQLSQVGQGHQRGNTGLAFAPNGRSLLSSSMAGTVRVWDWPGRCTSMKTTTACPRTMWISGGFFSTPRLRNKAPAEPGDRKREGASHPDRNSQFEHINRQVLTFQRDSQPVISLDIEKMVWVGEFKNPGQEWEIKGNPTAVDVRKFTGMRAPSSWASSAKVL